MTAELVWFKRDLRVTDHSPLLAAAKRGKVICLYIYEPDLISADDFSKRHLLFINDSLTELDRDLRRLGSRLLIRRGDAVDVISGLHAEAGFHCIRAHQETTNALSYQRDRAVKKWARSAGIDFIEYRQQGVVRAMTSRDGWARQWQGFVTSPLVSRPGHIVDGATGLTGLGMQSPQSFALKDDGLLSRQTGGENEASKLLNSFLSDRSRDYLQGLSSPLTAWDSCSRLSPYLTYGNISLRTVYQRVSQRKRELQRQRGQRDPWSQSLSNYVERLAWHCHFMQKLEDEPAIEFDNMNPAFNGLREDEFNPAYFEAWAAGRTGYPLIDACMRALQQTGWINFRMRAMLISFASYHLWLHWRQPALHLARLFTDYEPGIHYSQIQMQAGTTGISALRIYSPIKQVLDQDPKGLFIRQWVPELTNVPDGFIAEPHRMPALVQQQSGCIIDRDYPAPIVDHLSAYRAAQKRMRAANLAAKTSGASNRVFQRHGSRRNQSRRLI